MLSISSCLLPVSDHILKFCVATVAYAGMETLSHLLASDFFPRLVIMTSEPSSLSSCYITPDPRLTYARHPAILHHLARTLVFWNPYHS